MQTRQGDVRRLFPRRRRTPLSEEGQRKSHVEDQSESIPAASTSPSAGVLSMLKGPESLDLEGSPLPREVGLDPRTARITAWADAFTAASTSAVADGHWWDGWLAVLARSSERDPEDDRAIIRDNRPHGYPTLSLLVSVASLSSDGVEVRMAALDEPGRWNDLTL